MFEKKITLPSKFYKPMIDRPPDEKTKIKKLRLENWIAQAHPINL